MTGEKGIDMTTAQEMFEKWVNTESGYITPLTAYLAAHSAQQSIIDEMVKANHELNCELMKEAYKVDEQAKVIDEQAGEIARLRQSITKCLNENAHLADGDNCTLIDLKEALAGKGVVK